MLGDPHAGQGLSERDRLGPQGLRDPPARRCSALPPVGKLLREVAQVLFSLDRGQSRHRNLLSCVRGSCGRKVSAFLCPCHARSPEPHENPSSVLAEGLGRGKEFLYIVVEEAPDQGVIF